MGSVYIENREANAAGSIGGKTTIEPGKTSLLLALVLLLQLMVMNLELNEGMPSPLMRACTSDLGDHLMAALIDRTDNINPRIPYASSTATAESQSLNSGFSSRSDTYHTLTPSHMVTAIYRKFHWG
jgi:hypothetical protein